MEFILMFRTAFYTMIILITLNSVQASSTEQLAHKILQAADNRNATATVFDRALSGNSQQDKKQALLALGRIGDKTTTFKISPFLYSKQPDIRAMAAFALGISGDPKAHKPLVNSLKSEQHPVVISRLLTAIGNIADPQGAIASILPFLNHKNNNIIASACDGLTQAWTYHRDSVSIPNSTQVTKLLELAEYKEPVSTHCLYTLSRLRQEKALFNFDQLHDVYSKLATDNAKILAIRIMGAMKNNHFLQTFIASADQSNPVSIRAEAASAIARLEFQEQLLPIINTLATDSSNVVKINLLDNLELTSTNKPLLDIVATLSKDKSQWVRHRAILALFAVKGQTMGPVFIELLESPEFSEQQLAIQILQQHKLKDYQQHLKILTNSKHPGIKGIATSMLQDDDPDEETIGKPKQSLPAVKALELAGKKLQIVTTKGNVEIQLMTSSPFTSANFYQLAISGFYNGLSFHRVIANFVAQGGDPDGTGLGGPDYSIREELYPAEHTKGTVGVATSGKDTGSSQFFFNTADNLHLNGHYTIFARVTKGVDVTEKLEVGDQIIMITELLRN